MVIDSGKPRPHGRPGLAVRRADIADAAIVYDNPPRRRAPQLQARDLEILRALWRYTFLSTSQIAETWWPDRHPSRPQIRLAELTGSGLVARFRPLVKRGAHQWIYQVARDGFRAAQSSVGRDGMYIAEDARWSERRAADMGSVEHILRVNGWMLAYHLLLGERLLDWQGAREARIEPADPSGDRYEAGVTPDASALVEADDPASPPLELLIELGRPERPVRLADRLRRYSELLNVWWRSVPRFKQAGNPPGVVFIADGYRDVDRLLRAADRALSPGSAAPARSRMVFCAEADLHRGDVRAWMLPAAGPQQRGSTEFTAIEIALPA